MLSSAYKRFDGLVPEPGDPSSSSGQGLDDDDRVLTDDHTGAIGTWTKSDLPPGQPLRSYWMQFGRHPRDQTTDSAERRPA